MLKIFNELLVFFEDAYREISVREYARLIKVSPPSASKILKYYAKEELLKERRDRNFIFYRANRENPLFIDLSKAYFRQRLGNFVDYVSKQLQHPTIILFGSLAKGETNVNSDIDVFVDVREAELDLKKFETKLKRKIQVHLNKELKNKHLKKNVSRGLILYGEGI